LKQQQLDSSTKRPFVYPPLPAEDGLRLLILHPSTANGISEPLEGTLASVPFSEKPKYLGLSYTWGGGDYWVKWLPDAWRERPYIVLNGRPFEIGQNLAVALARLRSDLPLTLWVDQICINQADLAERNAQVALMAFIYSRAATVVSWLSSPPFLLPNGPWRRWDMPPHQLATDDFRFSPGVGGLPADEPYWTRLWIVQEVCLARSIVFLTGDGLWSEQHVAGLVRERQGAAAADETPMARLVRARANRFNSSMRLEALVEKFMRCGCGERRDRVYGLVGLANDVDSVASAEELRAAADDGAPGRGRGVLLIDYARPFYDIWCDVVAFMHFRARPRLDFGKTPPEMEDERRARLVRFAAIVQRALDGGVETVVPPLRAGDPRRVTAKGYVAGRVVSLGPAYGDFVGSFRARQRWVGSWEAEYAGEDDLARLREMEETYEAKIIGYSRTELGLVVPIQSPATVAWSPLRSDGEPAEAVAGDGIGDSNGDQPDCEPRRFLGDKLCMGLAPSTAQEGDLVIRFWNCDAAIVVRQEPDGQAQDPTTEALYRLVGRADIAENYKRENDYDHHAKDRMVIHNALYQDGKYVPDKNKVPRTTAMYVRMDFATLQNVTAGIGL